MNARTIYKRLYKSTNRNMWGIRSYASVVLPAEAFSVPPPKFPEIPSNLKDIFLTGDFEDSSDGSLIRVSNISCGDPELDIRPFYIEGTLFKSPYGYYKWWEASRCFSNEVQVPYKEPWVLDYIKVSEWEYNAHLSLKPEMYRLNQASFLAKSTYWRVLPNNTVEVSFGVKQHNLRKFAAAFSRAVKHAKYNYEIKTTLGV